MSPRVGAGAPRAPRAPRPTLTEPAYSLLYAPATLAPPAPRGGPDAATLLALVTPLLDDPLNPEQAEGFARPLESRLSLLWGPPGTGKTTVLAAAIVGWLERAQTNGEPVCIGVGSSNWNAIDHLLGEVADLITKRVALSGPFTPPVRLARVRSSYGEPPSDRRLEDVTRGSDACEALRSDIEARAQSFVVGGTWQQLSKMAGRRHDPPVARWFDLLVIDEASQVRVASAAAYFLLLREEGHVVLAGDDKQLGPIYAFEVQDAAGGLFDCIFTFLDETHRVSRTKLVQNYRTNIEIADWPRERFYEGSYEAVVPRRRLRVTLPAGRPAEWPEALPWTDAWRRILDPALPVAVVTYPAASFTLSNPFEAQVVAALATLYRIALGADAPALDVFWRHEVGIVTPHRAQLSTIRTLLERQAGMFGGAAPAVDTVDRFQGQQRTMVISSYAVADRDFVRAEERFILDPRRFNVTLTRARAKFVMVISDALVQHLASDADVARRAAHLQLFVQDYCRPDGEPMALPYTEGDVLRQMPCRLRSRV